MKSTVGKTVSSPHGHRPHWLHTATERPLAALRRIRLTGQLGGYYDPGDARRTGARF